MIDSQIALLRHVQDFFASDLVGLYRWDAVKIADPERRVSIPSTVDYRERRRQMEAREGLGKYIEQARIAFPPWEIVVYSSVERPPLGEVLLRDFNTTEILVSGPLDPLTWAEIGKWIRENDN